MKRIEKMIIGLIIISCVGLLSVLLISQKPIPALAADIGAPVGRNVDVVYSPEYGYTLLTANTAGFTGSSFDFGFMCSKMTVAIAWGGTAPTSTSTVLQGSLDNSTFTTLVTHSSTATGDMFHVVNKPVRYVKGGFASKVGGDSTTTVTMKIWGGGN